MRARLVGLGVIGLAGLAPAQRPRLATLAPRIAARVAEVPGATAAVAALDLASGDTLFWRADTAFHAASTMKVPVLVTLYRRADAGLFALDSAPPLVNRFRSIVDASPYALAPGDDADPTLYARVGTPVPLRELARRMIVRSSNLATNALIDLLGAPAVAAVLDTLGVRGLSVRRGVEDIPAFRAGLNNTTTARGLAALLAALESGRAASPAATAQMREILLAQEFSDEIPAGLPAGTPVAHKTGWITGTLHDAAIVYPPDRAPFVLVVLTGRLPDQPTGQRLIADIARMVWGVVVEGRPHGGGGPPET